MIIRKKTYKALTDKITTLEATIKQRGYELDEAYAESDKLKAENAELRKVAQSQAQRLAKMKTYVCKECKAQFLFVNFVKQKTNQVGNIRLVAVCPKCGSKRIKEAING